MYYKVFSYYPCDFHTQLWKCLATTVLKIRLQLQKSFQPIVCELNWIAIHSRKHSGAGIWGPGGPLALPIFSRSVNPIPTGGGQIMPSNYYWNPQIFSPSGITEAMQCLVLLRRISFRVWLGLGQVFLLGNWKNASFGVLQQIRRNSSAQIDAG